MTSSETNYLMKGSKLLKEYYSTWGFSEVLKIPVQTNRPFVYHQI